MKTKLSMFIMFLLGGAASVSANDWQYWSTWSATHNISKKEQVSALTEIYFHGILSGDNVYDEYVTYARKLGHGFGLSGQLYFESVKSPDNKWNATRSAVAGLSYAFEITKAFAVKIEDRFFYRLNSPAEWDYHRPRLYLTRGIGPVTLTLSDEMRIDLTGVRADKFFRNRIYANLSTKISPAVMLGLGYLRQSDKIGGSWASFVGVQSLVTVNF
jgi:hypothetical protein